MLHISMWLCSIDCVMYLSLFTKFFGILWICEMIQSVSCAQQINAIQLLEAIKILWFESSEESVCCLPLIYLIIVNNYAHVLCVKFGSFALSSIRCEHQSVRASISAFFCANQNGLMHIRSDESSLIGLKLFAVCCQCLQFTECNIESIIQCELPEVKCSSLHDWCKSIALASNRLSIKDY